MKKQSYGKWYMNPDDYMRKINTLNEQISELKKTFDTL